ncbi:MAG: intein-containing reverse gyrase, partial [Dictyoglomi bacterium]|nr:intein-containing reverse gyrase [Dictyoglomota bacterium]
EKYGEELFHGRYWDIQTSEHMQGAHECIRPTRPIDVMEFWDVVRGRDEYTKDHGRLYGLIFRRFMASQSVNALLKYLTVLLKDFDSIEVPIEVEKEGYLVFFKDIKIYSLRYMPEVGSQVSLNVEVVKKPLAWPMREEEVIRQMKEKGIGRPSTYGKILETIKKRGYVRVSPKGYLIPTKIGIQVYDYLNREFHEFISPDRTALLYKKMDGVEDGEYEYMELLKEVYDEVNAYL